MILSEKEAEAFLKTQGFPIARQAYCTIAAQAVAAATRIGYPVAVKVVSPAIIHKSDAGGVMLNLITAAHVKKAFAAMRHIKGFRGVLVQEYMEGDCLLLGLKRDPVFGHTIAVGAGGIYTEVLKDVSFRVCPITRTDALDMLNELQFYPIIAGTRGRKSKISTVTALLLRLSKLAATYPQILELDINPLLLTEHDVRVVDARILIS